MRKRIPFASVNDAKISLGFGVSLSYLDLVDSVAIARTNQTINQHIKQQILPKLTHQIKHHYWIAKLKRNIPQTVENYKSAYFFLSCFSDKTIKHHAMDMALHKSPLFPQHDFRHIDKQQIVEKEKTKNGTTTHSLYLKSKATTFRFTYSTKTKLPIETSLFHQYYYDLKVDNATLVRHYISDHETIYNLENKGEKTEFIKRWTYNGVTYNGHVSHYFSNPYLSEGVKTYPDGRTETGCFTPASSVLSVPK